MTYRLAGLLLAILPALIAPAMAAPPPLSVPISGTLNPDGTQGFSGFLGGLQRSNYLLGDMFGLRPALHWFPARRAKCRTGSALGADQTCLVCAQR
jgi:hypothetical protein